MSYYKKYTSHRLMHHDRLRASEIKNRKLVELVRLYLSKQ